MTTHTPGPWHVEPTSYPERAHPQVYAGKKRVACPDNSKDVPAPESDYNATLIAAAPDLLAACETAINIDWHGFGAPHVYEQLRAAIEKAREGLGR